MGTMANSAYPDEMLYNAAFHQGLHCLLRQNQSSEKTIFFFFFFFGGGGGGEGIITCYPSICTMDHHDFSLCSFMENVTGLKRERNGSKVECRGFEPHRHHCVVSLGKTH